MKKGYVLMCALLAFMGVDALSAPVQWEVSSGGNGHYYEVVYVPEGVTWTQANLAAQSLPGDWHLATIASAAENDFVYGLISNDSNLWNCCAGGHSVGPWIGGYKENTLWKWVTGEPFTYTNWGPSEPFGNGDRISFYGYSALIQSYWNDLPDSYPGLPPKGYIIENPVPLPAAAWLLGTGIVAMLAVRRKRY